MSVCVHGMGVAGLDSDLWMGVLSYLETRLFRSERDLGNGIGYADRTDDGDVVLACS